MGIETRVDTLEEMCDLMCNNTLPKRNNANDPICKCGICIFEGADEYKCENCIHNGDSNNEKH